MGSASQNPAVVDAYLKEEVQQKRVVALLPERMIARSIPAPLGSFLSKEILGNDGSSLTSRLHRDRSNRTMYMYDRSRTRACGSSIFIQNYL